MMITAIKAAAFIAFFGITVGLMRPTADHTGKVKEDHLDSRQVCCEQDQGFHQETLGL